MATARKRKTREEVLAERREKHLSYLEEVTSIDQLSVGDQLLVLSEHQLPKSENVDRSPWGWGIDHNIRVVESIKKDFSFVRLSGFGDTYDKHRYSFEEPAENSDISKIYRANPFHTVVALTKTYCNKYKKDGVEILFLPEMPLANECDRILVTIFEEYFDEVIPSFGGFKEFDTCMSFQKAFRAWDVISSGLIDRIAWTAIDGATLFHHFYNHFVLMQFDEYKEMLEKDNNVDKT